MLKNRFNKSEFLTSPLVNPTEKRITLWHRGTTAGRSRQNHLNNN